MSKFKIHRWQIALLAALIVGIISKKLIHFQYVDALSAPVSTVMAFAAFVLVMMFYGGSLSTLSVTDRLYKTGLKNHTGQVPILLSCTKNEHGLLKLKFENRGIPREDWEDKQAEIESALNILIDKIYYGKNRRIIIVEAVPATQDIPKYIEWDNRYLSDNEFELTLGMGLLGLITTDLCKIPHILLGGSSGSGKTMALRCILGQCIAKGADVIIADFKSGLDYGRLWHKNAAMIFNHSDLRDKLQELVDTLNERETLLSKAECPNIQVYNSKHDEKLTRIILACDELAEVLDKTGKCKEAKTDIDEIINMLSTIARKGRATGLHLVLSTKRPDANIVPGQIKCNIDCRICGRADLVLSQIILDNGDANDKVDKYIQGRFLTNDGTLLQGFMFTDKDLEDILI